MNAKVYTVVSRIMLVTSVLFFLVYTAGYLPYTKQKQGFGKTDLAVFYVVGDSFLDNPSLAPDQIYTKNKLKPAIRSVMKEKGGTQFLYPPAAALFFIPFAVIKFKLSVSIWLWLNAAIFILAYYFSVYFLIPDKRFTKLRYSVILALLAFSGPVYGLFHSGQVNAVIWLLLILGFILLRKQHQVSAGVALAIPVILKLFSGLFFLPLLFRKQFLAIGVSVISILVAVAISLIWFDVAHYQNYWDHILPGLARGDVGDIYQSPSLFAVYRSDVRAGWFDFLDISRKHLATIGREVHSVLSVLVLGSLCVGWFLHRNRPRGSNHDLLEYSQVMLFILLFSISVHAQWLIWTLPLVLFLISLDWSKRHASLILIGHLALFLVYFYNSVPWLSKLGWTLIRPSTTGLLILFGLSILLASNWWERKGMQKQNTP